MRLTAPAIPPLLTAIAAENPMVMAVDAARRQACGAGDLFWAPDERQARLALVLEPEVPTFTALEMLPLAMVGLGDCLSVLLPPKVALQFHRDFHVEVNGARAGEVKCVMAATRDDKAVPGWLVISVMVALCEQDGGVEPGVTPDVTNLAEEGWSRPDLFTFIETFSRHFLAWLAVWEEDGFLPVARAWKLKDRDMKEPDRAQMVAAVLRVKDEG